MQAKGKLHASMGLIEQDGTSKPENASERSGFTLKKRGKDVLKVSVEVHPPKFLN